MFTEDFIKQVLASDTLFTSIDTIGDNVLHMDEFKAYVEKYNPDKADSESVLKEFNETDTNHDNLIQFDEFLRAICKKNGVPMKPDLDIHDKL